MVVLFGLIEFLKPIDSLEFVKKLHRLFFEPRRNYFSQVGLAGRNLKVSGRARKLKNSNNHIWYLVTRLPLRYGATDFSKAQ